MLERYQRYIPKLSNIAELKHWFVDNMEWFPEELKFIDIKAIVSLLPCDAMLSAVYAVVVC